MYIFCNKQVLFVYNMVQIPRENEIDPFFNENKDDKIHKYTHYMTIILQTIFKLKLSQFLK